MASEFLRFKARQRGGASADAITDQGLFVRRVKTAPTVREALVGGLVVSQAGAALSASLIPEDWVLEGEPEAHALLHSESKDGMANTVVWECTPGAFNWSYGCDETIYIIEGAATLTEAGGIPHRIGPGSIVYCPAGSEVRWDVFDTVRKVATERRPLPRSAALAMLIAQKVRKVLGLAPSQSGSPLQQTPARD